MEILYCIARKEEKQIGKEENNRNIKWIKFSQISVAEKALQRVG
jgi:hypothetical protein